MANQQELQEIVTKIFKLNKKIRFVAVISDSGKRKKMRQEFNKSLGKVRFVNVERENISQIVTYNKSKSVFVTIEPELTVNIKSLLVSKIKKITVNLN